MTDSKADKKEVRINKEWCKGCGICVAFCPAGVLSIGGDEKAYVAHPEKCTHCGLCELRCPDMAIEQIEPEPQRETSDE
jgi:2-oxoglutarate ferredoxin oxidoreductase subunit delta